MGGHLRMHRTALQGRIDRSIAAVPTPNGGTGPASTLASTAEKDGRPSTEVMHYLHRLRRYRIAGMID